MQKSIKTRKQFANTAVNSPWRVCSSGILDWKVGLCWRRGGGQLSRNWMKREMWGPSFFHGNIQHRPRAWGEMSKALPLNHLFIATWVRDNIRVKGGNLVSWYFKIPNWTLDSGPTYCTSPGGMVYKNVWIVSPRARQPSGLRLLPFAWVLDNSSFSDTIEHQKKVKEALCWGGLQRWEGCEEKREGREMQGTELCTECIRWAQPRP